MRTKDVRGTLVRIQRGTRINRDHEMEENRKILDRLESPRRRGPCDAKVEDNLSLSLI
jgi:hypothetical protein